MGSDISHHSLGDRSSSNGRRARLSITSDRYSVVAAQRDVQSWMEMCRCPLDDWHRVASMWLLYVTVKHASLLLYFHV